MSTSFANTIKFTKFFFDVTGVGFTSEKFSSFRFFLLMTYLFASVTNNIIFAYDSLKIMNVKEFSASVLMNCTTLLVILKSFFLFAMRFEYRQSFKWIENCFDHCFETEQINTFWMECRNRCSSYTINLTRYV